MSLYQNDCFIKALKKEQHARTPIWLMRQAGRYLPEYRKVRSEVGGFLELCKNPELAAEVTLQPLRRFDFDASIVFSDILTIPDAMGLDLTFEEGEGPCFKNPIRTAQDLSRLKMPNVAHDLSYVLETIDRINTDLKRRIPLIGFSGSPFTLACYMVEGSGSKNFSAVKRMMFQDEALFLGILEVLIEAVTDYLRAQILAGAYPVMIFDTWGGILSPHDYQKFSLNPMQEVIQRLKEDAASSDVPVIIFTKGGGQYLAAQAKSGADCLGLDWTVDLKKAFSEVGHQVALQGNLDPCALYAPKVVIEAEAERILKATQGQNGFIFNLGHGILPDVNPQAVEWLVECVHQKND